MGRDSAATEAYRRAASVGPDEGVAHFNVGNLHLRRGGFREAAAAYERAADLQPRNPLVHFYLARSWAELGELALALRAARVGLRFAPNDPRATALVSELEAALRGRAHGFP